MMAKEDNLQRPTNPYLHTLFFFYFSEAISIYAYDAVPPNLNLQTCLENLLRTRR